MKWFKHKTDGRRSEKLSELRGRLGLDAVARWYMLLEIVAEKMDESDRCHAEYSIEDWCRELYFKRPSDFTKFAQTLVEVWSKFDSQTQSKVESISFQTSGKLARISIPKLLKYKDEYSSKVGTNSRQKSGQTPPQIQSKDIRDKIKEQSPQPPLPEKPKVQIAVLLSSQENGTASKAIGDVLKSAGNGEKWKEQKPKTPNELTDFIIDYLEPFTDPDNRRQIRHKTMLAIEKHGFDCINNKYLNMIEKAPSKNKIGFWVHLLENRPVRQAT